MRSAAFIRPRICAYAFTTAAFFFERLLRQAPAVEWSLIVPRGHHLSALDFAIAEENLFYLYADFNRRYRQENAPAVFSLPPEADNIQSCLLKDKDGYRQLEKDEQLRRAGIIYQLYKEFLLRVQPDFLLFPDVEVVDGFILLSLCAELGIRPIYHVGMRFLGGSFFSAGPYEQLPEYFGEYRSEALAGALAYVEAIDRGGKVVPWPQTQDVVAIAPFVHPHPFLPRLVRYLRLLLTSERLYAGEDDFVQNVSFVFRGTLNRWRRYWFGQRQIRFFDLRDDQTPLPPQYVLYALQCTPESSINGLEPYFVDQLRVIDRLLLSLPHNFQLLVKEHPGMAGVRDSAFYRELRRRPGAVLVAPKVDTTRLIRGATLVATVTGTIGLESYLLGRPCCLFGRSFFSHLCYRASEWLEQPGGLGKIIAHYQAPTAIEKATAIARLLNVRYDCDLTDPFANAAVMSERNVAAFAEALRDHLRRLALALPEEGSA